MRGKNALKYEGGRAPRYDILLSHACLLCSMSSLKKNTATGFNSVAPSMCGGVERLGECVGGLMGGKWSTAGSMVVQSKRPHREYTFFAIVCGTELHSIECR